jgi:glycosyltransferase involved in cell wall biosynthesis
MAKSDQPSDGNTVTAVYVGGFDQARDLQTVMGAASLLAGRGCDGLNFRLVGGSRRDIALLKRYASTKRLVIDNISFHKWIDRDHVERILDHSQIGLVPHVRSPHTDSTIPHKLFQYMAAQLPVVASNCLPLQRIVSDAGCGVIYESGNSESLAECLEELYRNPDERKRMGDAGLFAAQMKYNWSGAAIVLLKAYRQLEADNTR